MSRAARRNPLPARPRFRRARATLILLAITWGVSGLIWILPDDIGRSLRANLSLSAPGLQRGYVWEIVTFLFVHAGFWHLLANSALLYFAGRALERTAGIRRFLIVFFLGGWSGGAAEYLQAMATEPATLIMGNSAAGCAVLLAVAMLRPQSEAVILLFFVIPLRIRALVFGLVILFGSLVLAFIDADSPLGHWGHFAGALVGLLLGFLMRSSRSQEVLSREQRMHRHHRLMNLP